MKIAPVADVKARLSGYLEACRKSPVLVTKNGRPVGMLVAVPDDEHELERFLLAHTPAFRNLLETAYERVRRTGGIPHDELWKPATKRGSRALRRKSSRRK